MADYIIVAVCVFAVTYLLKYTDGPADIFARIRRIIELEHPIYDDNGELAGWIEISDPDTFLAKLFSCWWCLSTWLSLAISILYVYMMHMALAHIVFIWIFAVGGAGFLHEITNRD